MPAIASSRPLGYARTGGLSGKWRKAKLDGLTAEQQRTLAERWFLHRSNVFASHEEDSGSIAMRQTRARAEAAEHIQDLHRDTRLVRLAETPLLLNGLIALAIQRIRLPRSRFKAYEELTRLLLEEQPKRREKAAYARGPTGSFGQENRERALARLAWETHNSPGSDVLDRTIARNALQDFCSTHLYKTPGEALEIAEELLAIGAEAVGILVEKSSTDIGFLHRAFQEFLTARYLSNLPFKQQKEAVEEFFGNPQWHDVLLCLCYLNTRAGEVDDFVAIVENIKLPIEMELARQSFLAEVTFKDLHCSADIARRLAEETFEIIETGVHEQTRERLVDLALDGLESDALRSLVPALNGGIPCVIPIVEASMKLLRRGPQIAKRRQHSGEACLTKKPGISEPQLNLLPKFLSDDPSVAKRLFGLLFKPAEPRLQVYALHALCLGWGTDRRLTAILNDSRLSAESALQSVALIHRVKRSEHDDKDREILMDLAGWKNFDSSHWREDRIRALIAGWPGDLEVKQRAIRSVTRIRGEQAFAFEEAGIILLEGFPQDDEVAEGIARLFRTEQYPATLLGLHSNWGPLVEAFSGHQSLGLAVDDWLERQVEEKERKVPEFFWHFELCLISWSARSKNFLLHVDEKTGAITRYQAEILLAAAGWGMEDEETATTLTRFAESDVAKQAAHLLPDILSDKESCRQRLVEILCRESEPRAQFALIGLAKLGVTEHDEEVLEAAASKYAGKVPSGLAFLGIEPLIKHFHNHPKVREIALHQLHNREGALGTVARVYSSDDEICRELLKLSSPLPAHIRSIIVDRLARLGPEDDFAHLLLADFDEDTDVNVKTAAAIGYARSLKRRDETFPRLLNTLKEGLGVIGPDLTERRQAAFSALLELDRLDVVNDVWSKNKEDSINFSGGWQINLRLAAHLTRRWNRVSKTFGESFWERMSWVPDDFLTEMAARTTDPELLDKIIHELKEGNLEKPTVASLQLCARQWRGATRLRELCLLIVRNFCVKSWDETAPGIAAAEILAEQFVNDAETLAMLESFVTQGNISSALVIALSTGWPASHAWEQLIKQAKMPKLLLPAQFHLAAASSSPDDFLTGISNTMGRLKGDIWEFLPSCSRAVTARFARDAQVRELAFTRLEAEPTSSEKMNFPYFLLQTNEQPERLQDWMRGEIQRQSGGTRLAEIALDVSTGTVRSVCHVLLEHLLV